MGKTRAEIQRTYRKRKKALEGEKYLEKERKRSKANYIPTVKRSKKYLANRRETVRKNVQKHRKRLQEAKEQINQSSGGQHGDIMVVDDENGVSSSTLEIDPRLVIKLPCFDARQRTRRRTSRIASRQNKKIRKLKDQNQSLQKRYKTVSKRYERIKNKTDNQHTPSSTNNSINESEIPPLTPSLSSPRNRVADELRDAGVTPRKIPRKVRKMLLLGNALAEEVNVARRENGKTG